MARIVATSAWTAVLAFSLVGCSEDTNTTPSRGGGVGGAGGEGGSKNTASSSSASSSTSGPSAVSSTGAGRAGGMPFVCDPAAEPGSIYELTAKSLNIELDPISMCKYRGDVMLVVNTAAV